MNTINKLLLPVAAVIIATVIMNKAARIPALNSLLS
jgi:hypothetical protein